MSFVGGDDVCVVGWFRSGLWVVPVRALGGSGQVGVVMASSPCGPWYGVGAGADGDQHVEPRSASWWVRWSTRREAEWVLKPARVGF